MVITAAVSYISPQKNPLLTIKYELTCLQTGKKSEKRKKAGPPTNRATAPSQKFLLLLRYNLFMGVNEMRVKIFPLLCRLGLVLQLLTGCLRGAAAPGLVLEDIN